MWTFSASYLEISTVFPNIEKFEKFQLHRILRTYEMDDPYINPLQPKGFLMFSGGTEKQKCNGYNC